MKKITVELKAEDLKKKLNLKNGIDGYTPIKGKDYFDGKPGKDAVVDTSLIALEASVLAQDALKSQIPTIPQIVEQMPIVGEKVRDSLELLPEGEKLKIEAIENLRKELDELKRSGGEHTVIGANRNLYQLLDMNLSGLTSGQTIKWNGTQWIPYTIPADTDTLQTVTDRGATTTNPITTGGLITPYVQFNTTATPITNAEGLLQWNATDGTLDLGMDGGDITQQIGQELFTKVRNESGYQTISNGQVVYISGRNGVFPTVRKARADVESTSRVLGVATQDIASPDFGFITTVGYVRGIKTNYTGTGIWGTTWVTGDLLYVSKTDAGVLTNVEPAVPHHSDTVGSVGVVSAAQGSILVTLDRHKTLEQSTDVNGTPLTVDGQFPSWHNTAGYFDFDKSVYKVTDFYESRNVTITRNANSYITSLAVASGRTLTPTRDANGYISSVTDGTKTWTFTRTSGYITSIAVT